VQLPLCSGQPFKQNTPVDHARSVWQDNLRFTIMIHCRSLNSYICIKNAS